MFEQSTKNAPIPPVGLWLNRILQPAAAAHCLLEASGTLLLSLALVAPCGIAQTLHSFTGVPDGQYPFAGLAIDKNGALYGTTQQGGSGDGTVFQVKPPSSPGGAWTESVIYAFPKLSLPLASPTVGPNGELYGTTYYGGTHYVGSVFALTPPSSPDGTWTETTLYSFSPAYGDPQNPEAGVVIGKNGVLYGTVQFAGLSPNCPYSYQSKYGCGGVFSLTPPGSPGEAWTEQTLYTFTGGNDGAVPLTDLVIGNNGELYGTTYFGGPSSNCSDTGCGTVFRLDPPGSPGGAWTETVLYSFTGTSDGGFPNAVVYRDGVLYGTVTFGGDPQNCGGIGCGGVFQLSPPAAVGESWTEAVIYSFTGVPDGLYPAAGLVIGKDGKLYGTTRDGGDSEELP